jgi:hypothetical protein
MMEAEYFHTRKQAVNAHFHVTFELMASQQPLKTVTLSGSFTTGPSGGLIPAAPTNRLQGES